MAVIARLDILIGVITKPAERGLKNTKKNVDSLNLSVKQLATAFLSLQAVRGTISAIERQFDFLDNLAKRSDSLGIAVDQLQALGLAADLAGADFATLTKSASVFQRRIAEANDGLATAQRAFSKLNLDPRELGALNTVDALTRVAEAFSDLTNQSERAQVAQELFGRAGQQLIPLLQRNGAVLREANEFLQQYGLGLSRLDVGKIEAANDAWTKTNFVLKAIFQRIAIELTPAVLALAQVFLETYNAVRVLFEALGNFLQTTTGQITAFAVATAALVPVVIALGKAMRALFLAIRAVAIGSVFAQAVALGPKGWIKIAAAIGVAAGAAELLRRQLAGFTAELEALDFDALGDIGDIANLPGLGGSRLANVAAVSRGSQQDFALLYGRELAKQQNVQQQQLQQQQQGNQLLNAIERNTSKKGVEVGAFGFTR